MGRWWFDLVWLAAFAAGSSAWCLSAGRELSATFDEPLYVACADHVWTTGSHRPFLKVGTMPLTFDVQSLPRAAAVWWAGGTGVAPADFDAALAAMRAGNLAFWWLLLGYAMLAGRDLAGPWAGRLAVAALACEPNFLAHACLATADIAVSAGLLAFAYHFRRGRDLAWRWRVGVPGVVFGLALGLKASALAFGPLIMLAAEAERLARAGRLLAGARAFLADAAQIGLVGLGVLAAACGCDWKPEPSFVAWAHKLPAGVAHDMMTWLSEHLCVFSNGPEALVRQIKHNMHGHGMYLLGRSHPSAVWYYFPVLLTIKLTAGWLAAAAAVLLARPRHLLTWAGAAAGLLLAYSLHCRVQIGVRLMLPVLALAAVALAAAAVRAAGEARSAWGRRVWAGGAAGVVACSAAASLAVWPDGLRHVNPLWGGVGGGYRLVSDSNYDWGQGLPDLDRWHAARGRPPLAVWYFGTDPAYQRMPVERLTPHFATASCRADAEAAFRGRLVAASATLVYGHALTEGHRAAAAYLRECEPAGRTRTFLVYDFRETGAAGLTDSGLSPNGAAE